jgi:hypothetical protein
VEPKRYQFVGKRVIDQIAEAPAPIQKDFWTVLEVLQDHPHPIPGKSLLGVLELKDPQLPSGYTVPFDNGLLVYQVMADYPIIQLVQVTWLP